MRTECATSSQVLFKFVLRPLFLSLVLYDRTTCCVCTRRKLPRHRQQSDFSARLYRGNLSQTENPRDEGTLPFHYIITSSCRSDISDIGNIEGNASHLHVILAIFFSHSFIIRVIPTVVFLFVFSDGLLKMHAAR